jgi:1-pyrroline-5-carboxylate dehydrogenase
VPSAHAQTLATYTQATPENVRHAIEKAMAAKPAWENMPFTERASIFLKAAELISKKYRYDMMAATMLGQGKNVWQAEIDSTAESCDFYRLAMSYWAKRDSLTVVT